MAKSKIEPQPKRSSVPGCRPLWLSPNQGSITDFCPPRPAHMLPWYHGRISYEAATKFGKDCGDFLVFTDAAASDQLTLCVRDDAGKYHKHAIVGRDNGRFGIDGQLPHHEASFPNVEQLIKYYQTYGLPIKDAKLQSGKFVRLENGVRIRADSIPAKPLRRAFCEPGDLLHFHFVVSMQEAEKSLLKPGDFLVRQSPEKPASYILSVRGAGSFIHRALKMEPSSGGILYLLPRQYSYEPLESVQMLDEWLQLHVINKIPIEGTILLINPVPRPDAF